MNQRLSGWRFSLLAGLSPLMVFVLAPRAGASVAYGSLNNFDCVNDTGVEAHGFEIELDDVHSTDITYTYDYNHYGVPVVTEDNTDPAHPKVFVRYAATLKSDGTWTAFTAIPSAPITPTDGHQFTNPSVNFGGEHFGVGYYGAPSAVKYNWLIDDGTGHLIHGPPVYIATPTFTYYPPAPAQPLPQVQAVVQLPPPEIPPALQFGEAMWVKDIKTTTHNAAKMELARLVDPDPENPAAPNWTNGEPAEVETEWRILQTEFANAANPKAQLAGVPEDLPNGDEVITRRYEFYKYTGPIDAESGEAMADQVAADGAHGVGSVTYNDHIDPGTGEWVTVTTDLSTVVVVGDFVGAQMAGFDVAPVLGLIDHIPDGKVGESYAPRTVVVAGAAAFIAEQSGAVPDGTTFDSLTGIFAGTPSTAGVFTFTVNASDTSGAVVSKTYTVTIADSAPVPVTSTIATSALPAAGGTTTGDGVFENGTAVTVIASHSPGYAFVVWTENGVAVSNSAVYPFTVNGDRTLVANFIPVYTIDTSVSPAGGGTATGGGVYNSGDSVTVQATPGANYQFVDWMEGSVPVSAAASYTFTAVADRTLVANFAPVIPACTIRTSASPAEGGTTSGGGVYNSGDSVTVQAAANANYRFVNWTEGGVAVSTAASYTFTAATDRALVANFTPVLATYTIVTKAWPMIGGTTSGGGVYNLGATVIVQATPEAKYQFVRWTDKGVVVSSSASYTFTATADRTLTAVFKPLPPDLTLGVTRVVRFAGKVHVSIALRNDGGSTARWTMLGAGKAMTLDGKAAHEHRPVFLGNISPGGTARTTLTFTGVKAGNRTLVVTATYLGGKETLTAVVRVP